MCRSVTSLHLLKSGGGSSEALEDHHRGTKRSAHKQPQITQEQTSTSDGQWRQLHSCPPPPIFFSVLDFACTSGSWGALLRASIRKQLRAPPHGEAISCTSDGGRWREAETCERLPTPSPPQTPSHTLPSSLTCPECRLWDTLLPPVSAAASYKVNTRMDLCTWWGNITINTRSPQTNVCVKSLWEHCCGI